MQVRSFFFHRHLVIYQSSWLDKVLEKALPFQDKGKGIFISVFILPYLQYISLFQLFFKQLLLRNHGKYGIDKFLSLIDIIHLPDSNFSACEKINFSPSKTYQYHPQTLRVASIQCLCNLFKIRWTIKIGNYPKFPWIRESWKHLFYTFDEHFLYSLLKAALSLDFYKS